jgi:hypothetical protein
MKLIPKRQLRCCMQKRRRAVNYHRSLSGRVFWCLMADDDTFGAIVTDGQFDAESMHGLAASPVSSGSSTREAADASAVGVAAPSATVATGSTSDASVRDERLAPVLGRIRRGDVKLGRAEADVMLKYRQHVPKDVVERRPVVSRIKQPPCIFYVTKDDEQSERPAAGEQEKVWVHKIVEPSCSGSSLKGGGTLPPLTACIAKRSE